MNHQEAKDMEAQLSGHEQDISVRRMGVVRITDEDANTTKTEAIYAVADVLRMLDQGMDARQILNVLERAEVVG